MDGGGGGIVAAGIEDGGVTADAVAGDAVVGGIGRSLSACSIDGAARNFSGLATGMEPGGTAGAAAGRLVSVVRVPAAARVEFMATGNCA